MKKLLILLALVLFAPFSYVQEAFPFSDEPIQFEQDFMRGRINQITDLGVSERFGFEEQNLELKVLIITGERAGQQVTILQPVNLLNEADNVVFDTGDEVILQRNLLDGQERFVVFEPYRLGRLFWLGMLFVLFVFAVARRQGVASLLGLAVTLLALIKWIIPAIAAGHSPFWTSFVGAVVIATITLYLAHGFKKRTTLAVISTLITLFIAMLMALLSVRWTRLFGLGSEDAAYLNLFNAGQIDLKGLLLGAIVIGTLGVLDDVTTTQTATVHEIHRANTKLPFNELFERGLSVGREHIASLVNTLVIAYVGASFPVFLLISQSDQPIWVILNNEFLAEEIVRTLVGSMTLIIAVPISTALAAYVYQPNKAKK